MAWFVSSMPDPYPEQHPPGEVRAHAGIVGRRGGALVHIETCPGPDEADEPGTWLCVVTDDRPGLLSLLSAAIAAHSLDILGARVYTRSRAGFPDEAVDLFSVKRLGSSRGPLALADLASIRKAMGAETGEVTRLLLWQFAKPVLWANVIAWPVGAYIMNRWLLGFAYRVDLEPWMFALASLVALLIAMLTVSTHSILVARANPVTALRYQ